MSAVLMDRDDALAREISYAHDRLDVFFVRVFVAMAEELADWQGPVWVRFEESPDRRGEGDLIFTKEEPA